MGVMSKGEVSWAHGFPCSLAKAFAPDLNEWLPTGYLAANCAQVAANDFWLKMALWHWTAACWMQQFKTLGGLRWHVLCQMKYIYFTWINQFLQQWNLLTYLDNHMVNTKGWNVDVTFHNWNLGIGDSSPAKLGKFSSSLKLTILNPHKFLVVDKAQRKTGWLATQFF